jgi:hypothetical protein
VRAFVLCCAVAHGSLSLSLSLTLTLSRVLFVCRGGILSTRGRYGSNHRWRKSPHTSHFFLTRCDGCDGDVCVVCEIDFWRCGLRTYSRPVGGGHSRQLMWESCNKCKILSIFFLSPALFLLERLKVSSSSVVRRLSSVPIKFPRRYISNDYTY